MILDAICVARSWFKAAMHTVGNVIRVGYTQYRIFKAEQFNDVLRSVIIYFLYNVLEELCNKNVLGGRHFRRCNHSAIAHSECLQNALPHILLRTVYISVLDTTGLVGDTVIAEL